MSAEPESATPSTDRTRTGKSGPRAAARPAGFARVTDGQGDGDTWEAAPDVFSGNRVAAHSPRRAVPNAEPPRNTAEHSTGAYPCQGGPTAYAIGRPLEREPSHHEMKADQAGRLA